MRSGLILLVVLLLVAAGYMVFSEGDTGVAPELDPGTETPEEVSRSAALRATGTPESRASAVPAQNETKPDPHGAAEDLAELARRDDLVRGRVVDGASGSAIAGAWIHRLEAGDAPAVQRLPGVLAAQAPTSASLLALAGNEPSRRLAMHGLARHATILTDAEGRFALARLQRQVLVAATGYLPVVLSGPWPEGEREIRLARGHAVRGRVVDHENQPVAGARVRAVPASGTPGAIEHYAWGSTNGEGVFELTALAEAAVDLQVAAHGFLPAVLSGHVQESGGTVHVKLTRALQVLFHIRGADGVLPKNVTVSYKTDGSPPDEALTLLRMAAPSDRLPTDPPPGQDAAAMLLGPIHVPCRHHSVTFTLKAETHEVWKTDPVALPREGGRTVIEAALGATLTSASLHVAFRDPDGQAISYIDAYGPGGANLSLEALEGQVLEAGAVQQPKETLHLTSLVAGRWRLTLRSPKYAPLQVEAVAASPPDPPVTAELRPVAKIHLVFHANEPTTVLFGLRQGGQTIPFFRDGAAEREDPDAPESVSTGGEGTLISGLGTGTYEIVVLSPGHRAEPVRVRTFEGETAQAEVEVTVLR